MTLEQKKCVPCEGGLDPLSKSEATEFMSQVPGWALSDNGDKIHRRFDFDDFVSSLEFINKLGDVAEAEGHHPDISFGWGYAEITFFTHAISGLHENDFIMAAKTNQLI
ncbi:MAG: pterin-4-alpha-carbinolamine dehydratase [Rhodospirillaceae bacterium]|nr:pterin-4-alpha-carbinolamine dehydratase [Rhodospirillaceae bacterium]|tara:strand:- start:16860 stop:17186 length:327 start_codon:yes stop_codon:yes gene_type:complete